MKNETPEAEAATKPQLDLSAVWKYLGLKTATSIFGLFCQFKTLFFSIPKCIFGFRKQKTLRPSEVDTI